MSSNTAELKNVDLTAEGSEGDKMSDSAKDVEVGHVHHDEEIFMPERTKPFVVLVACCAALGGLIFGYDIAGAGATFVMDPFKEHFGWICGPDASPDCVHATDAEKSLDKGLINGLFGAGATIGAAINPYLSEKLGRRRTLAISTWIFILGAAIQTYSPEMWVMWLGRVFAGMGIGMLSMCAPVYVSELAPEHKRGVLTTLWQLAVTCGIVVASAANMGLKNWQEGWRLSYGGNILFAIILLGCLMFMPESPRWLAAHGTEEQVEEALRKVRYDDEIANEKVKLYCEVEDERSLGTAPWSEVFSTKNNMLYRITLGFSFFAFQQLSGINAIMFYAPDILNTFFTESQAIAGTFGLNAINFLATFITIAAVDRYGRIKLFLSGGVVMFFTLLAVGVLSAVEQTKTVGYLVILFAAIYIISFAYSWGPLGWVVCSEMFPYRTRSKATGITTGTHWLFTTIIGSIFPIASTASLTGCFIFFAVAIACGTVVVYFFQPETANKTSFQIDEAYANHKVRLVRTKST